LNARAVRYELNKRWTIIGETFALLPQSNEGGHAPPSVRKQPGINHQQR
jgi:hypothetical protein